MKETIIKVASMLFKIDGNMVFERTRKKPYVSIRQLVCYYLYRNYNWTYERIGELFGLDYSTVIFGVRNFENKMSTYAEDKLNYMRFKTLFENEKPVFDKELLLFFLEENKHYLSEELKQYLSVRL